MAKIESRGFASLVATSEECWEEYIGEGLLVIYVSERQKPGQKFVRFFPYRPDEVLQPFFTTVPGVFEWQGDIGTLQTSTCTFTFSKEHHLTQKQQEELVFLCGFM